MKGVELPINVLVIVAVAVIVLLGIAALFITGFSPFSTISGQESYKNTYCTELTRGGCVSPTDTIVIDNFDANGDGFVGYTDTANYAGVGGKDGTAGSYNWDEPKNEVENPYDNLAALCANYYGSKSETDCKKVCVCPGY